MTSWQIARHEEECGHGGDSFAGGGLTVCRILPGEPVQVLEGTAKRRVRCRRHAIGPVDEAAIEAAYTDQAQAEISRAAAVADQFAAVFGRPRLPFDGKLAAAGRDGMT